MGKYIAVKGRVELDKNGVPGITAEQEEQIQLFEEE
jgi:DNA/RNA endonuclease YhcR with UshA esterase domain